MKTFIRTSAIAFGLAVLLGGFAVTESKAQGVLNDILRRMDDHHKALSSLKADVTMVKLNAQLGESDTTVGSTSYLPKTAKRGMYVRIDWTKPVEEQIAVIGDDYKLYRPRLNQVIVGKVNRAKNNAAAGGALGFMSMSKEQLRANYTVKYIGQERVSGGVETWHLELTPKGSTSYRSAELWVDGNGMPVQAKIIENNNDTTTVLLSNLKKNETLNADIFRLKYPKSVKEIKG